MYSISLALNGGDEEPASEITCLHTSYANLSEQCLDEVTEVDVRVEIVKRKRGGNRQDAYRSLRIMIAHRHRPLWYSPCFGSVFADKAWNLGVGDCQYLLLSLSFSLSPLAFPPRAVGSLVISGQQEEDGLLPRS